MQETPPIKSEVEYLWTGPAGESVYRATAWLGLDKCPVLSRIFVVEADGSVSHAQNYDTEVVEALRPKEGRE